MRRNSLARFLRELLVGGVPPPREACATYVEIRGVRAPRPHPVEPTRSRFWRRLAAALALAFALHAAAADLQVRGLGWFNNRTAGQKLKLLLGETAGATFDANALEDAALILISALNDDGYLAPTLTVQVTRPDGSTESYPLDARLDQPLPRPLTATAATFHLAHGRRYTLREIAITGLQAIRPKTAQAFFVGENLPILLASERLYSPGRLQSGMANLEETLRQQGYAEAAVTLDGVQIDDATGQVRAQLTVREGRRWQVTALRFAPVGGGEAPTGLDAKLVDRPWTSLWRQDAMTAVRRWYYVRGHPDVQVKLTPQAADQPDGTKAVTVVAEIAPGPEVRLGAVRFTGNDHTRESVLRRLVRSQPGDLLNPIKFDAGQGRISQLGIFRNVVLAYDPPEGATRDAVYELTEGRRQEINLLAGYGSYEQLRAGIDWQHHNLFGRGHTDSLKLVQSMKSSQGDYVYTVPELFGTTTDGSVRLFGLHRHELSFVREEYGANVSLLWPLHRLGVALTTGYTFKRVNTPDNELATHATDQAQADVASLILGAVRDRRDNPLRPRKGYKLSLQVDAANRALGGEVVYQQIVAAASYHTGWGEGRWIHLGLAHGLVTTFGAPVDSTVPVSVLFFPGGDGSIRGYQKGEAAPRTADGLFIGAKTYTQFNVELEQALTTKWSVVAFGDAVGMAALMADYPFAEELYSIGLGVRYQTIIGPVRVEYGRNLNPRPGDPSGTLQVSIGFPFCRLVLSTRSQH